MVGRSHPGTGTLRRLNQRYYRPPTNRERCRAAGPVAAHFNAETYQLFFLCKPVYEFRFYDIDDRGQHQYAHHHIHHHEDAEEDAHLRLKSKGREIPEDDTCSHHGSSEKDGPSSSGDATDYCFLEVFFILVDLHDAADYVEPVIDTKADTERDDREGVDVEPNAFPDHEGERKEVGKDEGHDEDDARQDGPVSDGAKDEYDREHDEEYLFV